MARGPRERELEEAIRFQRQRIAAADIAEGRRDAALAALDAEIARLSERRAAVLADANSAPATREDAERRIVSLQTQLGAWRAAGLGGGRGARPEESATERVLRLRAELAAIQAELGMEVGS